MTHYLFRILGWQNTAALSYPSQPQPPQPPQPCYNNMVPSFPYVPTPFGMPPLPNQENKYSGVNLSYGFAPNVTPCHIPNAQRPNNYPQAVGPQAIGPQAIGWSIGDRTDGACASRPAAEDSPAENKQVEVVCRAIIVPEEDMPIYSFGDSSVSLLMNEHFFHIQNNQLIFMKQIGGNKSKSLTNTNNSFFSIFIFH